MMVYYPEGLAQYRGTIQCFPQRYATNAAVHVISTDKAVKTPPCDGAPKRGGIGREHAHQAEPRSFGRFGNVLNGALCSLFMEQFARAASNGYRQGIIRYFLPIPRQ